jgi:hypothetical protein
VFLDGLRFAKAQAVPATCVGIDTCRRPARCTEPARCSATPVHHRDLLGRCDAVKVAARSSEGKSASCNKSLGLRPTHEAAGSGTRGALQTQNDGINRRGWV